MTATTSPTNASGPRPQPSRRPTRPRRRRARPDHPRFRVAPSAVPSASKEPARQRPTVVAEVVTFEWRFRPPAPGAIQVATTPGGLHPLHPLPWSGRGLGSRPDDWPPCTVGWTPPGRSGVAPPSARPSPLDRHPGGQRDLELVGQPAADVGRGRRPEQARHHPGVGLQGADVSVIPPTGLVA